MSTHEQAIENLTLESMYAMKERVDLVKDKIDKLENKEKFTLEYAKKMSSAAHCFLQLILQVIEMVDKYITSKKWDSI